MEPIPLPSPIHYELILQLLERKTRLAVSQKPELNDKVQQLIIAMRKAVALQKQVEELCQRGNLPTDYFWSINHVTSPSGELPNGKKTDPESHPDSFPIRQG
ncbi:MAG TPA: DUF5340 domain-containing protein [Leptolyngbyaceae cyanobacterium]